MGIEKLNYIEIIIGQFDVVEKDLERVLVVKVKTIKDIIHNQEKRHGNDKNSHRVGNKSQLWIDK